MTEFFLGLIPVYGLYVVFLCVFLACLAIPLPSSVLVLAAGGFAAAGDLALEHVLLVAFIAYCCGDQVAFAIARRLGEPLLSRLSSIKRMEKVVKRSKAMVSDYGLAAVLISHTVLSPSAPYVSYICGINTMSWRSFSLVATCGALLWTLTFVFIGYYFSSRFTQLSELLISLAVVIVAVIAAGLLVKWLRFKWRELHHFPV